MTILLAVVSGGALGYVLARGDFCFHSTWRGLLARPPRADLLRAYLMLLLIAALTEPRSRSSSGAPAVTTTTSCGRGWSSDRPRPR